MKGKMIWVDSTSHHGEIKSGAAEGLALSPQRLKWRVGKSSVLPSALL